MPKRLWVKSIDSVGLVDAGDDPEAMLTFFKRKTTSVTGDTKQENDMAEFSLTDLDLSDDQAEALDTHIAGVVKAAVDATEPPEAPVPDDVFKGFDGDAKAAIEELQKRADDSDTALAAEIEKNRNAEYVAKAEPFIGLVGDDGATILAGMPAETATAVLGWLEAATEQIGKGDLFKSIGDSDGDGDVDKATFVKQYLTDNPGDTVEKANAAYWTPERIAAEREAK